MMTQLLKKIQSIQLKNFSNVNGIFFCIDVHNESDDLPSSIHVSVLKGESNVIFSFYPFCDKIENDEMLVKLKAHIKELNAA